jgi:F-type H+-transporting ATPase subunit b
VDELKQEFADKLKEIDSLKRQRIQEGAAEAQRLADSIKGEARREAQEIRERAQVDAHRELDKARAELRNYIVDSTIRATEVLIGERLDDAKHRDLIGRSIEEMSRA